MPLYARGPGCGACLFTFELGVTWHERLFAVLPRTAQHLNRADTNRCLTTVVLGSRGLMSIDMSRPNWGDASGAHCPYYLRLFSLCNAESPMERMLLATLNQRSHDDDITGYCCSLRRVVRLVVCTCVLLAKSGVPANEVGRCFRLHSAPPAGTQAAVERARRYDCGHTITITFTVLELLSSDVMGV
jgi:hypothetical protein